LELVEQKVLPHFDFERMTMLAVGKDWSRATPEQQKALTTAFRTLLVKTYSSALSTYKDNKIDVLPVKGGSDDNTSVRTQVSVPGTGNVALDYRMHKTPSGWKVHDVSVEGVSLVTTYRSSFKTELDRSGFDGLIKLIADRAQGAERPAARAG
jgi:phospholipid transport system substrate-binding protein